jgi:hypothetical protein
VILGGAKKRRLTCEKSIFVTKPQSSHSGSKAISFVGASFWPAVEIHSKPGKLSAANFAEFASDRFDELCWPGAIGVVNNTVSATCLSPLIAFATDERVVFSTIRQFAVKVIQPI